MGKILIDEDVVQQALDALEPHKSTVLRQVTPIDLSITALRAAIERKDKVEPMAWLYEDNMGRKVTSILKPCDSWRPHTHVPLYALEELKK